MNKRRESRGKEQMQLPGREHHRSLTPRLLPELVLAEGKSAAREGRLLS